MYEVNQNNGETQCLTGLNKMTENPSGNRCPHCFDKCFAKEISVSPVQIREEKFISSNDVVSTIITTDRYAKGISYPRESWGILGIEVPLDT